MVAGARLKLAEKIPSRHQETGLWKRFWQFIAVLPRAPGRFFQITLTSAGFCVADVIPSGNAACGESYTIRTPRWPFRIPSRCGIGLSQIDGRKRRSRIEENSASWRAAKLLCHLHPECSSLTRSRSSSGMEDGDRSVTWWLWRELREWSRRKITLPNMGKARRVCQSASAPAMPIRRLACSLVPPYAIVLKAGSSVFLQGTGSTRRALCMRSRTRSSARGRQRALADKLFEHPG